MKKNILMVLALLLIMTSSVFASMSHEGSLEFTWDKDSKINHSHWVQVNYDFYKDFGNGIQSGLTLKMNPADTGGVFQTNWDGWANVDLGHTFVNVSTWQEFTGASSIFAQGMKLPGGPGIVADFKQFGDLWLQGHAGNYWTDELGMTYTYGAKASYALDDVNVNVGFHGRKPEEDLLFGAFVGADTSIVENVDIRAEVAYRNDLEDWRQTNDNWYREYVSGTAVGAEVDYAADNYDVSVFAMYKSPIYIVKEWDNDVANNARDLYLMSEWTGVFVGVDVEYDVTRYLTAKARVDALLGVTDSRHESNYSKVEDIKPLGFKVEANYRAALGTTVSGWYSHYDQWSKVGAGVDYWELSVNGSYDLNSKYAEAEASYTFADGFVGTLFANKADGQELGYGMKLKIDF